MTSDKTFETLRPNAIVQELDRYIIGQHNAKKAVAIALRNRWRRLQLEADLREEVVPKNILMIGPTGVGKTEIARRLAKLAGAPFLKVEATKFTEVGYVGKDVESIIRDLIEVAVHMTRDEMRTQMHEPAQKAAEERVLDALVGTTATEATRESFRRQLHAGNLNDKIIEIEVEDTGNAMPSFEIPGMPGASMSMINIGDMIGKAMGNRTKKKSMSVEDAHTILVRDEADKLLDDDRIMALAMDRVQQKGIVFIDEIDKIAIRNDQRGGDVSREGVQRDLLPLIEGTTVATKYGPIKTDHILFIASGAFHYAKPSDLLAELQGRLPIRVELMALTQDDFKRILTETDACLIKQYTALLATDGVHLTFEDAAVNRIAAIAFEVNAHVENIGARRLMTVMEKLLEEISFTAGDTLRGAVTIAAKDVDDRLNDLAKDTDLSRYIL